MSNRPRQDQDAQQVWGLVAIMVVVSVALTLQLLLVTVGHAEEIPSCRSIKAVLVPPQAVVHQPDGDTFHIYTFDVPNVVKIRVQDVDTPERGQPGFEDAKDFTWEWLQRGPFRVVTCGEPTLDRVVAVVMRDGKTLAEALKDAGHAREKH